MLVCVTGGTGFLGSHTVAELVRAGHRVRILARNPDAVAVALTALGIDLGAVDVVAGDVTRQGSVASAVRGADGLVHAASVYSFDSRHRVEIRATNLPGTEIVLGSAIRAGVGRRIVHVSTFGALLPAAQAVVNAGRRWVCRASRTWRARRRPRLLPVVIRRQGRRS